MKININMKLTTISNIKSNFTYWTVRRYLSLFWVNRVIVSNQKKIWLTILVKTTSNKAFFVIKNLPFNTKDFKGVLIVLLAYFKQNKDILKRYQIKDITIVYELMLKEPIVALTSCTVAVAKPQEIKGSFIMASLLSQPKYWIGWYNLVKSLTIFILSALFIVVSTVLLIISLDLIIEDPGLLTRDDLPIISFDLFATCSNAEQNQIISNYSSAQSCIFSPFIDLFHKSNSVYKYFPSYFVNGQPTLLVTPNSFSEITTSALKVNNLAIDEGGLMAINNYNQYFLLEYRNNKYYILIYDLYNIVSEYIQANK
jgi:hypothetical protein